MIPTRYVVARPHGRVSLHARVARARQHEGARVRSESLQSLEGRARHLHAEDVVVARVRVGLSVARVHGAERKGLHRVVVDVWFRRLCGEEDARLVHVVPESGDAFVRMFFVERAEPLARLRVREVWEGAHARPHGRVKLLTVRSLDEVAARTSLLIDVVVRVNFDAGVYDDDCAEACGAKVCD